MSGFSFDAFDPVAWAGIVENYAAAIRNPLDLGADDAAYAESIETRVLPDLTLISQEAGAALRALVYGS